MEIQVRRATVEDKDAWFEMRKGVWPDAADDYLNYDLDDLLASERDAIFMIFVEGVAAGVIEASLREYGEGCDTSPVGYIESWFVQPRFRGRGLAGVLAGAAEDWARAKGCTEMASDTWLGNESSIRTHLKSGYAEAERLIHFVKQL